jgi:hypothetical protein
MYLQHCMYQEEVEVVEAESRVVPQDCGIATYLDLASPSELRNIP